MWLKQPATARKVSFRKVYRSITKNNNKILDISVQKMWNELSKHHMFNTMCVQYIKISGCTLDRSVVESLVNGLI